MRIFVLGSETDRKFVRIEVRGRRMVVVQGKGDGTHRRSEKELASEAQASAACAALVRELTARGYAEQAAPAAMAAVPAAAPDAGYALENPDDEAAGPAAPVLPRMAPAPAPADQAPQKAKDEAKAKRKKRRKAKAGEGADWTLAGIAGAGVLLVGVIGYFVWSAFLRPASIVGTWQGSKLEYEIGKPIIYSHYHLILDEQRRAALTLQKELTMVGTYAVAGDRLRLSLLSEDGDPEEFEYTFSLGRVQLELTDPGADEPLVKLVRLHEMQRVPPAPSPRPRPAFVPPPAGEDDPEADEGPAPVLDADPDAMPAPGP